MKMIFAGQKAKAPPLYACSEWEPSPNQVPLEFQARINHFLRDIKSHFKTARASTNLLPLQTAAFRYLQSSDNLIVMKTDKNLGPAIMQVSQYKRLAYADHLSHDTIYQVLTFDQATI